jgi:hypothetical protein
MTDEMFIYGVEKALPANAFKRGGYAFAGWSTSADGEKVYEDNQQILNLSVISGTVINLYATWKEERGKVQLWEGGPYWATTNIGAEKPEDSGYYFWWGDTVGYKRENDKWVASDGSNSNFSFIGSNTPTYINNDSTLQSEGWVTSEGILTTEHDAAYKHWGDDWRMPTNQEFEDLKSKCDWTWTTINDVEGYVVSGKDDYSSASIFLPCAGYGNNASLKSDGVRGQYWSSVLSAEYNGYAWYLFHYHYPWDDYGTSYDSRFYGNSIRPVQSPTK